MDSIFRQAIRLIDANTGKEKHSFSCAGKEEGQVYFPRCIQRYPQIFESYSIFRYKDDILVMDKTGKVRLGQKTECPFKFQRFDINGKLLEISARIDAYLANGFTIMDDEALIACSGIVLDEVRGF